MSLIIVDCNPNMNASLIDQRAVPLVHYLRGHGHATTPIVLSEGTVRDGLAIVSVSHDCYCQ